MLSLSFARIACVLGFLSYVNAAISILTPNSQTTWYKNSTVQMTWSSAAGDPNPFRIFLGTPDANATLADSVNTDLQALTILLPQLADAKDYLLYFVNTTNITQVYASSQPFAIAAGEVFTSSVAAGTGTAAASASSGGIPGPYTPFSSTGVRTATASVSPTSSSSSTSDATLQHVQHLSAFAFAGLGIVVGVMVL